eukprot:scaffold840_cov344-Pavlova_lutheri.AAC.101
MASRGRQPRLGARRRADARARVCRPRNAEDVPPGRVRRMSRPWLDLAPTVALGGVRLRPRLRTCMDAPVPQRDLLCWIPVWSRLLLLPLRSDGKEKSTLPLLCDLSGGGQPVRHRTQLLDAGHHQVHDWIHKRRYRTRGVRADHGIRRAQRARKGGTRHPLLLHRRAVLVARRGLFRARLEGAHGLLFPLCTALSTDLPLAARIPTMAARAWQRTRGQDRPRIHGRSQRDASRGNPIRRPSTRRGIETRAQVLVGYQREAFQAVGARLHLVHDIRRVLWSAAGSGRPSGHHLRQLLPPEHHRDTLHPHCRVYSRSSGTTTDFRDCAAWGGRGMLRVRLLDGNGRNDRSNHGEILRNWSF